LRNAMRELNYLGGRHGRIPVRGRPLLFHRDEHPPFRLSIPVTEMITDIDLVSGSRSASPTAMSWRLHRRGREVSTVTPIELPHQCRESSVVPPPPRARSCITIRPAAWGRGGSIRPAYQGYVIPARITISLLGKLIVHGKTRRECLNGGCGGRSTSFVVDGRSRPRCRCSAPSCGDFRFSSTANYHIHWARAIFLAKGAVGKRKARNGR